MEESTDEGFPEVFLHTFGLQHQAIMQFTQLLYEAVRPCSGLVVLTTEVLRKAWGSEET
jgi:hypothetical protein